VMQEPEYVSHYRTNHRPFSKKDHIVPTVFGSLFAAKKGPAALFRELCNIHDLDKKTVKLLTQITTELNLEQPAMVFIDPTVLRKGVTLPSVNDSVTQIRELYYRWFGGAI